jgi:hypothetical protein
VAFPKSSHLFLEAVSDFCKPIIDPATATGRAVPFAALTHADHRTSGCLIGPEGAVLASMLGGAFGQPSLRWASRRKELNQGESLTSENSAYSSMPSSDMEVYNVGS